MLHGICYAFFFATVYIFVDEFFPKDVRASAQGLFNLLILGLGPFVGSLLWGALGDRFTTAGQVDFTRLFMAPAWLAVAALVLLLIGVPSTNAEHGTVLARRARQRHHGALQTKLLRVVGASDARVLRDLRIGAQRSGHLDAIADHACGLDAIGRLARPRASARARAIQFT